MPFKIKNSPDLICVHILGVYGGIHWDMVSLLEAKVKYKIVKVHSQVSLCTQVAYQPIEGALYLWYCFLFLAFLFDYKIQIDISAEISIYSCLLLPVS